MDTPDPSCPRPVAHGRKLRIVIVDDDVQFCHLMEFVGVQHSLLVTSYHAVEYIEFDVMRAADVIVVDFDLGSSNGLALSEVLRQQQITAPLLLISASQDVLKMEHWADHVCGFASKELGPFAMLTSILELTRVADAPRRA